MKLNLESVNALAALLTTCRVVGIEAAVLSENKFRGINAGKSICILADAPIGIDENTTLGIGRVNELFKRLDLFSGNINVETKVNNRNEVSQLTISSGKSKADFRCTSEKIIRYPKSNEDGAIAAVSLSRVEVETIAKAANAMGALHVVIQCGRNGQVKVECVEDSTNDTFALDIETEANFVNDASSFVLRFLVKDFVGAVGLASKTDEIVNITFGSVSATLVANKHTLVMLSQLTGDEDE